MQKGASPTRLLPEETKNHKNRSYRETDVNKIKEVMFSQVSGFALTLRNSSSLSIYIIQNSFLHNSYKCMLL